MDRHQEESLRRVDFVWALGAHGASIEFQKVVRRSRLSAYFKSTARDICLQDFILRIFPNATAEDLVKMQRWVNLRKAWKVVTNPEFEELVASRSRKSHNELKHVFALLEEDCSGSVSVNQLVRAQILSRDEVLKMLPPMQEDPRIGDLGMVFEVFEEYVSQMFTHKQSHHSKHEDKENIHWEESVIHDHLAKLLHGRNKKEFKFPFATDAEAGADELAIAKADSEPVVLPPPLPPGTVAALIERLMPMQRHCKVDMDASPMCELDRSPVVSAC